MTDPTAARPTEPAGSSATSFDEASRLVERGPGRYDAEVHPEWTIGGKPNGGYLLAVLARAAASLGEHPHVVAASAHYLHSPDPGPVDVTAELLRGGRTASQVRCRMSQDGRACVEALLTLSRLDTAAAPYWDKGVPERSPVGYDDCARLPSPPEGLRVALMDQVDLRLEPGSAGFTVGRPAGRGELRGWLALLGGEAFDPSSLLFAVDAFPPATFDIEFAGWVPTLELTAYVRALPAPGPVQVLQRAQLVDAQRVDEDCFVWDATGRLVAHGTQLAGVRLG